MSITSTIEPYRKGTPFGDWAERLEYSFQANKVEEGLKKSHLMNLCGSFLYSQLKQIFQKPELDIASYDTIVEKLKLKLDKTEPDLVQRYRFGLRKQQPDETAEEFVQAVKLQAEFCNFGDFKNIAILDRVLVGLADNGLKEQLLKEEKLTVDKMDKFITTWNIARHNVQSINTEASGFNLGNYPSSGLINQIRRPVKERLGYHPYNNNNTHSSYNGNNNYRPANNNNRATNNNNRLGYGQQRTHNYNNTQNPQSRFHNNHRNNNQRNTNHINNNRSNDRNRLNNRNDNRVKPQ